MEHPFSSCWDSSVSREAQAGHSELVALSEGRGCGQRLRGSGGTAPGGTRPRGHVPASCETPRPQHGASRAKPKAMVARGLQGRVVGDGTARSLPQHHAAAMPPMPAGL